MFFCLFVPVQAIELSKCQKSDGHIIYTNSSCPPGTLPLKANKKSSSSLFQDKVDSEPETVSTELAKPIPEEEGHNDSRLIEEPSANNLSTINDVAAQKDKIQLLLLTE